MAIEVITIQLRMFHQMIQQRDSHTVLVSAAYHRALLFDVFVRDFDVSKESLVGAELLYAANMRARKLSEVHMGDSRVKV